VTLAIAHSRSWQVLAGVTPQGKEKITVRQLLAHQGRAI
jgi:hypothetical protein